MTYDRNNPVYRFDKTYEWNYREGPCFEEKIPPVPECSPVEVLGHSLNSPLGISAGILLNANWVSLYARLGFDLLTYKTVRSAKRPCYPLPNWVFLDCPEMIDEADSSPQVASLSPVHPPERTTGSVSFGMPSMAPEVWRPDVTAARKGLREGQVLCVSVVGTPDESGSMEALADDYALCARWAVEAGADWVEANLSCPNVCSTEGEIFRDADSTRIILQAIRSAIPRDVPLLIKIGTMPGLKEYRDLIRTTREHCNGIVLVNCIPRRIINPDGSPVFGPGRETAGVMGWATRAVCLTHTSLLVEAVRMEKSPQAVLSVGGVVAEDDGSPYLQRGSQAVLMGGAPVFDPFLAIRIRQQLA